MLVKDVTELKRKAGEYAVQFIESGMVVGLGHGTTAIWAVRKLAELLEVGKRQDIVAIPCSQEVEAEARKLGIPLTDFEHHPAIDVTIDGADEVSADWQVIKGGGGALLREKIVAQASQREIIVVDESKLSDRLGVRFSVPVEVVPFGWSSQVKKLETWGARWTLRRSKDGRPYQTDQTNFILDCKFPPIDDPFRLARDLCGLAVVVEHGLFLGLATDIIVASENGINHIEVTRR